MKTGLLDMRYSKLWPPLLASLTPERMLRWSLGLVYLWFGALKLADLSPAMDLIRSVDQRLAAVPLYCGLTMFELGLGIILLAGCWKRRAASAAILHLLGTFAVLITAPDRAFLPFFPFLTLEGEFLVKNLVLLAAAASIWRLADRTALQPHLPLESFRPPGCDQTIYTV